MAILYVSCAGRSEQTEFRGLKFGNLGIWASSQAQAEAWATKMVL